MTYLYPPPSGGGSTSWSNSYTPTWGVYAGSNHTLGDGVLNARWRQSGPDSIDLHMGLGIGTTTVFADVGPGSYWYWSLPPGLLADFSKMPANAALTGSQNMIGGYNGGGYVYDWAGSGTRYPIFPAFWVGGGGLPDRFFANIQGSVAAGIGGGNAGELVRNTVPISFQPVHFLTLQISDLPVTGL